MVKKFCLRIFRFSFCFIMIKTFIIVKIAGFYHIHCVFRVVLVRIFPYSDWVRRDTEWVSLGFQSEWGKMLTRITPNTDTFHAVTILESGIIWAPDLLKVKRSNLTLQISISTFLSKYFDLITFTFIAISYAVRLVQISWQNLVWL